MFSKKIVIITILTLIFLSLFGCGEMDRTQKTLCYSLTTKSYAYVPSCDTEKTCYKKVDELFNTNLDHETESQLFYLKNNWARSWFFYNKAINEIKKAPNLCLQGDAAQLTPIINQTNKYLDHSFSELDEAMKRSFDIISAQEKILTEEKTDLIKEEALYDSLIELRQITTEVNNPQNNSGTYLSFYYSKVNEFNALGIKKGYQDLVETDSIQIKSFGIIGEFLYDLEKTRTALMPFLGISYQNVQSTMENLIFSSQGLKALSKFPISEFTKLYSSVAGNQNSSLEKFSKLMNNTSKNKKATIDYKEKLITEITNKRAKASALIEKENKSTEFIYVEKYFFGTTITNEKTNKTLFEEIETENSKLREKKSKSQIKLGEELLLLKSLDLKLNQLINNLETPSKERIEKVTKECLQKAQLEKENINNAPLGKNKELESLQEEVKYYSNKVISSKENEIIYYCNKLVINSENLIVAKNNYDSFILTLTKETQNCFSYLEKTLPLLNELELTTQFNKLKQEKMSEKDITYFNKNCENIKKQALKFIEESFEENGVKEELEEMERLKNIYLKTKYYLDETTSKNIELSLNQYLDYFNEKNIADSFLLGDEIKVKLKEKNEYIKQLIKKASANYAQNNYYFVSEDLNYVRINQEIKVKSKLYINNPFGYLEEKISIKLKQDFEVANSHSNCYFNSNEEGHLIEFKCLEEGLNFVEIYLTDKIVSEEKNEIIYASNKKSLIKREILLKSEINFPFIIITTKALSNDYSAYHENQEIFGSNKEGELEFIVSFNNKNKKIEIFFYSTDLIKTEKELISKNQKEPINEIIYKIKLKNNSTLKFDSTIIFPIILNGYVEEIKIINQNNEIKNYEIINQEITLKKQTFLELEEKEYFLKLKITLVDEYYIEILTNLMNELDKIENTTQKEEIKKILKNPQNYSADTIEKVIESSKKILTNYENKKNNEQNLNLLKNNLQSKIEEKLNTSDLLLKYGLEKEAMELKSKIEEYLRAKETESQNKIVDIYNSIEKYSYSGIQKMILKSKEISEKMNKLSMSKYQQDIFNTIEKNISQLPILFLEDPKKAEELLIKIKEDEILFYENNSNQPPLTEINEQKILIGDLINECYFLVNLLEKELEVDEKELINAKFIPPITLNRVKKIKLELNDINFSKQENNIPKLMDYKAELKTAYDSLKKQTISLYNTSIDKKIENELLKKSKELIDSNKYVAAFLILSNSKDTSQINFINFVPIIIILVLALFVKSKFGKEEKEKDSKKKIIQQGWED